MKRIKTYNPLKAIALIACLLVCLSSRAQVMPGLQNNFSNYQKTDLQEKLFVHTDKSFYVTGEILWFKIYCTDGSSNKMLDLSKVAYVELLDNKHSAVLQAKILLSHGTGNGSFYVPFSLINGNYELRAYTSWMKNFDADYFFTKQIAVINPVKTSPQVTPSELSYDVQFFPEGGHLVKGLNSKIAFKVTASDGKGADCSGVITGPQNDTVVRFSSLKFGIGSFTFVPLSQTGYKAIIKIGDKTITKDLPEISPSGYVMQVANHDVGWDVEVHSTAEQAANDLFLIVHSRHEIKEAIQAKLADGVAHFTVSKNKLADGVNFITLFDGNKNPLCERLVFKRPAEKLIINAAIEQVYSTRKKVDIIISTQNQLKNSLPAGLSVAVFHLDSLQKEDDTHIAGYLWLNADLKGHIESPDYYLDNSNEETNEELDNLMLSQGWTQFDWTKIVAGATPQFNFLPEYTGHIVSGKIISTLTNAPAPDITAYLTVTGSYPQLSVAKSDSSGRLVFDMKDFYGLHEMVTQTKWQQDSTYRIDIVNPFSEDYEKNILPPFHLNTNMKDVLVKYSLNMQVQNIFLSKQLNRFNNPATDSSFFYGKPTYTYLLDDYTRFRTIEDVIHEYVKLVGITHTDGKRSLEIVDNKVRLPGQPLVMLDGRPIFDLDRTFAIDPLKVKRLDVVTNNYIYGSAVLNGILNFTTYTGLSTNIELDSRSVILDYDGLQLERKFYSPVYDSDQQINSTIPDFRNVLYWNPNADTDAKGQVKLRFYTGDKPGRYIGVIEGFAPGGEAGSQHFFFEVKK